jgi:heterodisulfide reductase subunit C
MTIAEGLILRKKLEAKVKQLEPIKQIGENGAYEMKTQRININDNIDEVKFQVPKLELKDVTKEYDKYAESLRKLDTAIQKANWATELDYTE